MALERDYKVLVLGKIDGAVSRWIELASGSYRIETWNPCEGWIEGGASLDEFCPGPSCLPVSAATTARLGIPVEELFEEGLV